MNCAHAAPRAEASVTKSVAATPQSPQTQPNDGSALLGLNLLIADRGNNRLLEVTPDKQVIWEYDFSGIPDGDGADDAFFTDDGRSVIVNLEHQHVIQIIDIARKKVIWQYGQLGRAGAQDGRLNYPDDAYKLPNGEVIVADIRNCRVLEISPDRQIVRQAGVTGDCSGVGTLASPNGDTPLPNGHILVSTIMDHAVTELDDQLRPVFKMSVPLMYPSDAQMTRAGNFLIADYVQPGKIIEIDRTGNIAWEYAADGEGGLNRPSLAVELPNGDILANDDLNHRVIVIDKQSKKIVWQYGVTGVPSRNPGYLSIPDGVDFIKTVPPVSSAADPNGN